MIDLGCFSELLLQGNAPGVVETVRQALDEGMAAEVVVNRGLIPAMDQVGAKFKTNEIFVPEVMLAARAMQEGLKILKPILAEAKVEPIATVVIGTVKGDHHDIGKNLVAMMMEGAGFRVVDLGTDVSPERFFDAARAHNAQQVAMSALLTTTMPMMQKTIEHFAAQGMREKVRFMVGGAPVSQAFADKIGADGYSSDASSAVDLAKSFL
ncbi:MAG TPA: corrinoid protein [Bacillota bacterium]|nr:corrinoid protein [Bacillota bacterium]